MTERTALLRPTRPGKQTDVGFGRGMSHPARRSQTALEQTETPRFTPPAPGPDAGTETISST
ncbi:MAG: hypothetical protein KDA96_07390 [Planctomycetaceae bacterium]|nr:hypothetical protein [Planctomycetaceae bacterium]